ncbi:DctP family TRAP transporter solute-binding subunit [Ammoniphilus sp. CFH 90114]|uniref:DctP family TRAP transporter solute-binding subunit n=1 Tax=Ammoniphilus sp. CFH 90114 TaxID=2493665 RepID=UPI00100E07EC|nr:DctP family TRAP transporter solute-binding subunit [Ammoniphilus sp. CFH 90114]RXT09038.1 DctP family TRAP transporter solute-binding subunit [Ammoniphilus sp. CFH 90114]
MKKLASAFLASALAVSLVGCGGGGQSQPTAEQPSGEQKPAAEASKEEIVIKFSHVTAPESVKGKAAQKFADLVAEKTGGQVKVEVYPSSQLYGDKDELDALVAGNVQMIAPSVTKMVKLDPRWQYVDMPFLFKDRDHAVKFFESDVAKSLLEGDALVSNDILGLVFWENGFKNFTNNKKALVTPADFNGLKFRSQAGKVLEAQFKAVGAGSATIPFGETYAALQQGTVDGQENTFDNMSTQKYQEVQKYLTVSNHGRLDYAIFVNKPFWEGMPADVRAKVEEALQEATTYELELAEGQNQKAYEELKASGKLEVTELTDEQRAELEKSFAKVYEEFSATITPELIDGIKNLK